MEGRSCGASDLMLVSVSTINLKSKDSEIVCYGSKKALSREKKILHITQTSVQSISENRKCSPGYQSTLFDTI